MRSPLLLLALLPAALLPACAPSDEAATPLGDAFAEAAVKHDVPVEVLIATSYAVSRFDQRFGEVNREGGVGLMNLREGDAYPSLDAAADAAGRTHAAVTDDATANIDAAAALLRHEADAYERWTGEPVDTLQEWYPFVAAWSGSEDALVADGFASQVYDLIQWGIAAQSPTGELVALEATPLAWRQERQAATSASTVDQWVPACSSNYSNYSRGSSDVKYVVIHTMEGTYSGSISWFQNCSSQVSAHYSVRSSDGEVTQSVDEQDVAWHAGNWDYNLKSIGIEHEGYVSQPDQWYTDAMYRASADLVRDICDRYGIAKDRAHIIGHNEVPGCGTPGGGGSGCHTDPGSGWNWDYFISLVNGEGSGSPDMGGGSTESGTISGTFDATVTARSLGETDTCQGAVSGAVNGGQFYLSGTCTLRNNPDASGNMPVTWTGSVQGSTLTGRMIVDGREASFTGQVQPDGSVAAQLSGSEDLRGDVGILDYEVSFRAAP